MLLALKVLLKFFLILFLNPLAVVWAPWRITQTPSDPSSSPRATEMLRRQCEATNLHPKCGLTHSWHCPTGQEESEGKKSPFPLPEVLFFLLSPHCIPHCAGRGLYLTLGQASLPASQLGWGSGKPRAGKGRCGGSTSGRVCLRGTGKPEQLEPYVLGGRNRLRGAGGRRRRRKRKLGVSKRGSLRAETC